MPDTKPEKAKLRYRAYFWLMDIAFVCGILGLANEIIARIFGGVTSDMTVFVDAILIVTVISINFALPFFLVLAKFMRDEYAEQLWRRTLIVLGYTVAIIPFAIWSTYRILFGTARPGDGPFLQLFNYEATFQNFMIGTWMTYMLLFVAIFQFLRWKDKWS